tara:strand:+ start:237 stop:629 length:393 start_codon:yes stop_codon:yes gene_type:complete
MDSHKELSDFLPGGADFKAMAGSPVEAGVALASEADLVTALKTVYDPEIPVDIFELGLIYEYDIDQDGSVEVKMSLTAPGCPVAGEMPKMVAEAVAGVKGFGEVTVELVWDPPWTKERMTEEAKFALDMW